MLAAVARVFESQHFILGPEGAALERELAAYVGVEHGVGCASGSDALLLALMALDVKAGQRYYVRAADVPGTVGPFLVSFLPLGLASGTLPVAILTSDLNQDEAEKFGAIVGALVGFGAGGEEEMESGALAGAQELEDGHLLDDQAVWYLSDAIPQGTAAAVALIEHRWAIPLRDKIAKAGGVTLADEWIHAADLIAVGLVRSSTGETAGASA